MTMEAALDQAKKLSPIASVAILLVMAAGSYFHGQDKTDELNRRVSAIEQTYVPRSEHAVKDADLDRRLEHIEQELDKLNTKMDRIVEKNHR